jgi:hypothetical protein
MSSDEAEIDVVVSVRDDHLDHLDRVVDDLRAAGLHVRDRLERLGTVTGSVPAGSLDSLSAIDGVDAVEQEREFHLPPPDSDVQ